MNLTHQIFCYNQTPSESLKNSIAEDLLNYLDENFFGIAGSLYTAAQNDKDDLIQQTLIKFFKSLSTYNPEKAKIETYISCILRNTILSFIKSQTKKIKGEKINFISINDFYSEDYGERDLENILPPEKDISEPHILKRDLIKTLLYSLRNIKNENSKFALFLRISLELSEREIAEITGRNLNTVKSDIARAIDEIKNIFIETYGPFTDYTFDLFGNALSDISITLNKTDIRSIKDQLTQSIINDHFFQPFCDYSQISEKYNISEDEILEHINSGLKHIMHSGMLRKKIKSEKSEKLTAAETIEYLDKYIHLTKNPFKFVKNRSVNEKNAEKRLLLVLSALLNCRNSLSSEFMFFCFSYFLMFMIEKESIDKTEFANKVGIDILELAELLSGVKIPDSSLQKKIADYFSVDIEYIKKLCDISEE